MQRALFGDGVNLGNRQRIWRKAIADLGIIKKIEGSENLYEPGPNMHKLGEVIKYRADIADRRLEFTTDGKVIPGRRARGNPSDADVSASASASGKEAPSAMETDDPAAQKEIFPPLPSKETPM